MDKKRILIVDDEQDLCEILQFNLSAAGYAADVAYSAEEAVGRGIGQYDLLLLDVMMPGLSGFELAERLKNDEQTAQLPIIFLTARDSEEDTLAGFGLGADDYVTKPFSVREVVARVNAVLKRNKHQTRQLQYNGLVVDQNSKTVTTDHVVVELTRTEFELLALLLSHRGRVFSRLELLDSVWPNDVIVTERSVDVSITRLRKKLGSYASCIQTRQGPANQCTGAAADSPATRHFHPEPYGLCSRGADDGTGRHLGIICRHRRGNGIGRGIQADEAEQLSAGRCLHPRQLVAPLQHLPQSC